MILNLSIITNIIGFCANITSLVLWIPQARMTWINRNNKKALMAISIGTQILVIINTSLWCIYGILIKNIWLPLATILILPLACVTIYLVIKNTNNIKETTESIHKWVTFEMFQALDLKNKQHFLNAKYTTNFSEQIKSELLNYETYEQLSIIDKQYWDRELWDINKEKTI